MNIYIGITGFKEDVFDKELAQKLIMKDFKALKFKHPNDTIVITSKPPAVGITKLSDKLALDFGFKVSDTSFGEISELYTYGDWPSVKKESVEALLAKIILRPRSLQCIPLPTIEKLSLLKHPTTMQPK